MLSKLGPAHYLFYGALYRKRMWLSELHLVLNPTTPETELKKKFFDKFPQDPNLGLTQPLSLHDYLDDTSPESFLDKLFESGLNLELDLARAFVKAHQELRSKASNVSQLWGRELAQRVRISSPHLVKVFTGESLINLFELLHGYLMGGDFLWKPLLLRTYSEHLLQYELRSCPHRMPAFAQNPADKTAADFACAQEAQLFQGFARAFLPALEHSRTTQHDTCLDSFKIGQ